MGGDDVGEFFDLIHALNLTPLNTVLLGALGFFLRWSVKETFRRLRTVEDQNREQDLALERLETKLGIGPRLYIKD